VDAGYDATNVLTARIYLPSASASPERTRQLLETLLARLRSMPGIVSAGGGNMMPFGESTSISGFEIPSRESGKPVLARALEYAITPGYAEALGLHLREGRLFTERDDAAATSAVLVNDEFARLYLTPGPIAGRLFTTGLGSSGKVAEVVGVVGNVLKDGLATKPLPEIYLMLQNGMPMREINLVVRTAGDPLTLAPALRGLVRQADQSAAIAELTPLARLVSASVDQPRFATVVLGAFAALALSLAGVGLYGVLSYSVSQRRRELGIRVALGAKRSDLIRSICRQGMMVTLAGLMIGLAVSLAVTRFMEGLLFGVKALDKISFAAAPVLLGLVAMAACLRPAIRAAATDPSEVLRSE
jgi:putative ABC transport system permease protein